MDQIIFVCTGNTCRSPMAEGLFRALDGETRTGLTAQSAGLHMMACRLRKMQSKRRLSWAQTCPSIMPVS